MTEMLPLECQRLGLQFPAVEIPGLSIFASGNRPDTMKFCDR